MTTFPSQPSEDVFYRFFNTVSGDHFFTADYAEAQSVDATAPQYVYEGFGIHLSQQSAGTEDLYRLFNVFTGEHFYTTDAVESASLAAGDMWRAEGVAGKIDAAPTPGDAAVHRFYDTASGTHFYTASDEERAAILANPASASYRYEGVIGYAPEGDTPAAAAAGEVIAHTVDLGPGSSHDVTVVTDYVGVLPEYPTPRDMGVDGAGESRITIPAGHSFFEHLSFSHEFYGLHSGFLTIDASAGTAGRAVPVPSDLTGGVPTIDLYKEAASAHSVINGCAGGLCVGLGPGTDVVHFNPDADNFLETYAPGNEAPYIARGHDVATGLGIGDHVWYSDTYDPHTFGHAADGSLTLPYDGRGEVTLLGVSSMHMVGEGEYVVDGVIG